MSGNAWLTFRVISTLLTFAVAMTILFLPAPRRHPKPQTIGLLRVLLATLVCSGIFMIQVRLHHRMGITFFGLVNLAFLGISIVIPALGAAVLLAGRRRHNRAPYRRLSPATTGIALLALLLAPIGAYARFIEPWWLKLEVAEGEIPAARQGETPITIGVLADIQTDAITQHEHAAIDRLMALSPDIILLPGDYYQGEPADWPNHRDAFRALFNRLRAPGGVFAVQGDCDTPHRLIDLFTGTPVRVLHNEIERTRIRDRKVTLCGIELKYRSSGSQQAMIDLLNAPGDDDIRILLAHRPDPILHLPTNSRIDLTVAGHTHGGQIALPFFGPPLTCTDVPRNVARGGLNAYYGNAIYISRGVGHEKGQAPRIRFLARPEISFITLTTSQP